MFFMTPFSKPPGNRSGDRFCALFKLLSKLCKLLSQFCDFILEPSDFFFQLSHSVAVNGTLQSIRLDLWLRFCRRHIP